MGSSSSSSSPGPSKDGEWTGKIYFDPDASEKTGNCYYYTDSELREELTERIDASEEILKVWVYDHPLYGFQITKITLKHTYVILETNDWWWSLEKNEEGLSLQRSKKLAAVRDRYRQKGRTTGIRGITEATEDRARGGLKLNALVTWLWSQDFLRQEYDLLNSNCQHFAKKVFDWIAKNKNYHP